MINIDYRDSRPIYVQIKDGIRRLIATGALMPGDKLPSVRALASQLTINPNTISRAYNELEAEGYIVTALGRGCFVSCNTDGSNAVRRSELLQTITPMLRELKTLGLSDDELMNIWKGVDSDA